MFRTVWAPVLLATLFLAGASPASEGGRFMVEMELWIDGEQRGTPIMAVEAGEEATMEVADPSGESAWRIELLVEPPAASEGAPNGAIWLHLSVYEQREGDWELLADSLLGVPEGRTGVMSVVEPGVQQATPENSLVYLTTRTSRLRPGTAGD